MPEIMHHTIWMKSDFAASSKTADIGMLYSTLPTPPGQMFFHLSDQTIGRLTSLLEWHEM